MIDSTFHPGAARVAASPRHPATLQLGLCGAILCALPGAAALAAELNGELAWANRVALSVPVSGRVEQLHVRPGALVDKGQLLLQFDTRVARAHLDRARAAVEREELERAEAQREWDRAKELYDRTVLSQRELQLAEIGFSTAEADYQAARAAQQSAEVDLEYHSVQAPFAARVLATHVLPGQAVINAVQATPLVTIAEQGRMRARAPLSAAQAAALAVDGPVTVRVGEEDFAARVQGVGAEPADAEPPIQYVVEVEFSVPPETALRAGQPATLVLP